MDKANLQLVRDSFGRVVYTHKAHEKDAEIQRGWALIVKWVNIALLALTSGTALSSLITTLFNQNAVVLLVITSVSSILTLGFSVFQLSFNPEQLASSHKQVANSLWSIRENYRHLIADIMTGSATQQEVTARRDALGKELAMVYQNAPATTSKGYRLASTGLKQDEEFTFSDEEIDHFLPSELALADSAENLTKKG